MGSNQFNFSWERELSADDFSADKYYNRGDLTAGGNYKEKEFDSWLRCKLLTDNESWSYPSLELSLT